jgi:signal transduction histidine kinase
MPMASEPKSTEFAPAERASAEDVKRQSQLFVERDLFSFLPAAVPCALIVLNAQRQIVFANQRFKDIAHANGLHEPVEGQRPGEALDCIRAAERPGGCGTTEFCTTCGAVAAILTSQGGAVDVQECRITRRSTGDVLELRVWATPVDIDGEQFTIFAALDISDEKRRRALERIFLHDIHNVACGIKWCIEFLKKAGPDELDGCFEDIRRLCRELNEEIEAQRLLLRAETGELVVSPGRIGTLGLLQDAVGLYRSHPVCLSRHLRIDEASQDRIIVSDRVLLLRVLCNLVKNGLEASYPDETVTIGCVEGNGQIEFWVHNAATMSREVQLQVFQRSFSTKGEDRGLGTYSIKLLTERYLQGQVSFTTSPDAGTTFHVRYPLTLEF